jgi:hypothetical protein
MVKLKTVKDFWHSLARMGGFIGRKSDGDPRADALKIFLYDIFQILIRPSRFFLSSSSSYADILICFS